MKKSAKILLISGIILLLMTAAIGSVSAKAVGNPKGEIIGISEDDSTLTLLTKDEEITVFLPDEFDYESIGIYMIVVVKGTWLSETEIEAEWVKPADQDDLEEEEIDVPEETFDSPWCNGQKTGYHPVVAKIAVWYGESTDVTVEQIHEWFCEGHSVGQIMLALKNQMLHNRCYPLTLGIAVASTGSGNVPTASSSELCTNPGEYTEGEIITVTAVPDEDSEVAVWSGTINDSSTANTNTVLMPGHAHSVDVMYVLSLDCFELTTSHTGEGLDPIPTEPNCQGTKYTPGTVVDLSAAAADGYEVASWSGTNNDASTAPFNSVTMNSDKSVTVNYKASSVYGPPASVVVPTGSSEWYWNAGTNECQQIDLRWAYNSSWSPDVPVYYEVFRAGSSFGTITGTHWNADFKVSVGNQITLGVRAIFAGGETSKTQEVSYACLVNDLVFWGSVVKSTGLSETEIEAEWVKPADEDDLEEEEIEEPEEPEEGEEPEEAFDSPWCNGQNAGYHPVVAKIAVWYGESTGVTVEQVHEWFCEGHSVGQIMLALTTQMLDGSDPGETLDQRSSGLGWGVIWKEKGLIGNAREGEPPGWTKKPDKPVPPGLLKKTPQP